jgi:hypothetical protein
MLISFLSFNQRKVTFDSGTIPTPRETKASVRQGTVLCLAVYCVHMYNACATLSTDPDLLSCDVRHGLKVTHCVFSESCGAKSSQWSRDIRART